MSQEVFTRIFRECLWGTESRSGHGSTLERTVYVRAALMQSIQKFGPLSFLDLPCGDGRWIRSLLESFDLNYTGADIVREIIAVNQHEWPHDTWRVLDVVQDSLPTVDMVFCRDCLVHLPLDQVSEALRNIQRSGSKHLMVTTFPLIPEGNGDIPVGSWRRLDLQAPPFNLPPAVALYNECNSGPSSPGDKSLGVWCLKDLRL